MGRNGEVHPFALDGVGRAPIHQVADEIQHLRHIFGGVGPVIGPGDAEPVHLLDIDLLVAGGELGLSGSGLRMPG